MGVAKYCSYYKSIGFCAFSTKVKLQFYNMQALRKLLYQIGSPDSKHPLALFHHCDGSVSYYTNLLDQTMKYSPNNLHRRSLLIRQIKNSKRNLIQLFHYLVDVGIPDTKRSTEFRCKYPDDIHIQDICGSIWFGAECLSSGSIIANHESESLYLKPHATRLTKAISNLRSFLCKELLLFDPETDQQLTFSENFKECLQVYDRCWVNFEYRYVNILCNVKTETELFHQQEISVLFSEASQRALSMGYFDEEMIEMMDPMVMFAIPRLAIICGLAINTDGPLDPQRLLTNIPTCFRQYNQLLSDTQTMLKSLSSEDLTRLERALCSSDGFQTLSDECRPSTDIISTSYSDGSSSNSSSTISDTSSTSDKSLQQLFLAVSEVADQLQSNYPRDYRAIMIQTYKFINSSENTVKLSNITKDNSDTDFLTLDLSFYSQVSSESSLIESNDQK
jgi:hypothetical protein